MFPLSPLQWGTIGIILALALGVYVQTVRLEHTQTALTTLTIQVKTMGEQAEKTAALTIKANKLAKGLADAKIKALTRNNAALNKRLLDARTSSGYVPPATPGTRDPERICFNRTKLDGALRRFDDEVDKLIERGDASRISLNGLKEWYKSLTN